MTVTKCAVAAAVVLAVLALGAWLLDLLLQGTTWGAPL